MQPPAYRAIIAGSVALLAGMVFYMRGRAVTVEPVSSPLLVPVAPSAAAIHKHLCCVIVYCRPDSTKTKGADGKMASVPLSRSSALSSLQVQRSSVDALQKALVQHFPGYAFRTEIISTTLLQDSCSFESRGTLSGNVTISGIQKPQSPVLSSHYTLSGKGMADAFHLDMMMKWATPHGSFFSSGYMLTSTSLPKTTSEWRYFCASESLDGQAGQHLVFVCAL